MIEVTKSDTQTIRLQVVKYQGKDLIDIRLWVHGDGDSELIPTRKGISFKPSKWGEFKKAVEALEEELVTAGLVDKEDMEYAEV